MQWLVMGKLRKMMNVDREDDEEEALMQMLSAYDKFETNIKCFARYNIECRWRLITTFLKIDKYIVFLKKSWLRIWSSCDSSCFHYVNFVNSLLSWDHTCYTRSTPISTFHCEEAGKKTKAKTRAYRMIFIEDRENIIIRYTEEHGDEKAKYSTAQFKKSYVVSDFIG